MVFSLATLEQVLVRDDQQRVDHLLQLDDAGFGKPHAALAFEVEGLGDDADCQNTELARALCNDRRSARSGAAAHAGRNEHHMGAREVIADLVDHFFCRGAPDFGLRTRAETFGHLGAHLNDAFGLGHRKRLRIRVGDDEVDALQACRNHVVDRIAAGATDAKDGDARFHLANIGDRQVDGHVCLMIARAAGLAPRRRRKCNC